MAKGIQLNNHETNLLSSALQAYYETLLTEEVDEEAGYTLGAKVASLASITMLGQKLGITVPEGSNG